MGSGIFITGTGTDVGKTYVTGLLLKRLRDMGVNAGYYKAAASGNERVGDRLIAGDAREVCRLSGLAGDPNDYVSYLYEEAVSPHLAARSEGNPVSLTQVMRDYAALASRFDVVVAEGSGGIVCPIRWDDSERIVLTDVIHALDLPIVIVADAGLGTINHAVLTVEFARARGLSIRGILLNRYVETVMTIDNRRMIEELTGVRILGTVASNGTELDASPAELTALVGAPAEGNGQNGSSHG